MNTFFRSVCLSAAIAALALSAGCDKKPADKGKTTGSNTKAPANGGAVIPATYFVEKEPAAAKAVDEVKKGAKKGDAVVMRGRIAGREEPFTSGRAEFMVTDLTLPICTDGCKTPWDHCCEDAKQIAANAATVQLVNEAGDVLKTEANGVHGLAPNAEIVVVGKIVSIDDAGNMVVGATQVYVKKS